jgi:hypothetical protein
MLPSKSGISTVSAPTCSDQCSRPMHAAPYDRLRLPITRLVSEHTPNLNISGRKPPNELSSLSSEAFTVFVLGFCTAENIVRPSSSLTHVLHLPQRIFELRFLLMIYLFGKHKYFLAQLGCKDELHVHSQSRCLLHPNANFLFRPLSFCLGSSSCSFYFWLIRNIETR